MEKEFIHPNLHVILVHYPLALLVSGTLIEIFSFMWKRHSFHSAGRWMILLGAMSGIPVALSGLYARQDVARQGSSATGMTWAQVRDSGGLTGVPRDLISNHWRLESIGVALAVLVCVIWIGGSDRLRARLNPALLAVLTVAVVVMVSGAWYGTEAVFRNGVGIAPSAKPKLLLESAATTNIATTTEAAPTTSTSPTTEMAGDSAFDFDSITRYAPPKQLHVILAGIAIALAMLSIGLSVRKITQTIPPTQVDHIAAALGAPPSISGSDEPEGMIDPQDMNAPGVPAARFWMLACLCVLLTAGVGYFMLATRAKTWMPAELWNGVIKDNLRQMAHVIAGGSLLVLPIVMAMLARWAPRQKFLLTVFTLLLLAGVLFQLWVGILLLYDGRTGPLNAFN